MPITHEQQVVADVKFGALYGAKAAGAFLLRFGLDFATPLWPNVMMAPTVSARPATVVLTENGQVLSLGQAAPQTTAPFRTGDGGLHGVIFELLVTRAGMEAIEGIRAGMSVIFRVRAGFLLTTLNEHCDGIQEVVCRVSQSDWLEVLQDCGYRRSLLIEISLPEVTSEDGGHATQHLERARTHMLRGHYRDAVAACHLALEEWTIRRNETGALKEAKELRYGEDRELSPYQGELLLRDAASAVAKLAHHATDASHAVGFDRASATMMIGVTASILGRRGSP